MWSSWIFVNRTKYERNSSFEWSKWPNPIYNIIRLLGFIILISLFFIIMIIVGIKKRSENQQSILLRIIANYLQLLTAAMSFNLKFPSVLSDVFLPAEKLGSSTESFLSFDWFLTDSNVITFTPNIAIFKVFLTGLLPIFLIIVGIIFWSIVYFIPRKLFKDFKRNICITVIVIIYLLHPMLTKVGLEMFQWIQVDESKSQARINLEFGCFSADHMKWCAFFGVPIVVFWSIGCPFVIFWIMFKKRHSLHDPNVQKYLLMMYQGLKDNVFYWELINTARKVLMIGINAFLSTLPLVYSATSAVLVLVGLMRLQLRLQPYKQDLNNKLEMEAMTAGTATLFWGVLFISDSQGFTVLTTMILTVIIIINIKFFLLWSLCMTHTLINRHEIFRSFFNILSIATCNRKLASKIIEEYESSKYDSKTNNISESIPSHLKKEFKFPKLAKLKAKHFIQSPEIDKIENQKKYKNNGILFALL